MIYNSMRITLEVEWLDPEGTDKAKRNLAVREKLIRLFGHEFAEMSVEQHGVKIEIVDIDGERVRPPRAIEENPIHDRRGP